MRLESGAARHVQNPLKHRRRKKSELVLAKSYDLSTVLPELLAWNRENAAPTISAKIIHDFCKTIQSPDCDDSCLGILVDDDERKHRVSLATTPLRNHQPGRSISLEALLLSGYLLPRRERLILGVKLASTVMQLHNTGWLDETWDKRDIVFLVDPTSSDKSSTERPAVWRSFGSLPPTSTCTPGSPRSIARCNKTLFSLGVVLLELWFWKSLDELEREALSNNPESSGWTSAERSFETADRMVDKLHADALPLYSGAVRRCIRGLDYPQTSLSKDDFKKEVYHKVVCPLEENMKLFSTGF
ncbi:hypothetical protein K440DRAFT_223645 [Wilcoxina mikolae CBS 423.85]|nr:hypothetical protein K440DRAFT_223645 [Wilcoxina mikolae CBS 423.85]